MTYGFWTCHDIVEGERNHTDAPPGESQLSSLQPGTMFVPGTSECYILVLREVFDSFDEGKVWMNNTFHETDWENYLVDWKARVLS